jgi:NhaP-type Na+/H+ or K+/H+ antiporter
LLVQGRSMILTCFLHFPPCPRLLWVLLLVVRAVSVVVLLPLLRFGEYKLNFRDVLVITWAGLRGAVGLTLAVIVFEEEASESRINRRTYTPIAIV